MTQPTIRWNLPAFEQIRRDPKLVAHLDAIGQAAAAECGPGYASSTVQGRTRARGSVITATSRAIRDNARHDTLLRVLGNGRW